MNNVYISISYLYTAGSICSIPRVKTSNFIGPKGLIILVETMQQQPNRE